MRRVFLLALILACAVFPWKRGDATERLGVIPESLLRDSTSQEIREVVEGASYVGEKKGVIFKGHRAVYEYLLNHLDFASQLGRVLDLSDYAVEQTGARGYEATTPRGGWAHLQVIYAEGEKRVVLARGRYGRAVVVLDYTSFNREGESYILSDLYGYVRADNPILDLLLGLFGGILSHRVNKIFSSVAELSERAYTAPATFYAELLRHPELPAHHRLEFAEILNRASHGEARAFYVSPT
ncbi:MAG: hypothetical protein ACE5IQ_00485 [Candidatus Methylomirabilales bacterium]